MKETQELSFKEWLALHEVGTSTSCVAGFSRMIMPVHRRVMIGFGFGDEEEESPKKRKKKKKD